MRPVDGDRISLLQRSIARSLTPDPCFLVPGRYSLLFRSRDPGDYAAHRQDRAHHRERDRDGYRDPVREEHLECDKGQQRAEAVVEIAESIEQRSEREVERAQAQDGRDIRRVNHEGSCETARTAGIESVAKSTSVNSTAMITGSNEPLAGCILRIHSGMAALAEPPRTRRSAA